MTPILVPSTTLGYNKYILGYGRRTVFDVVLTFGSPFLISRWSSLWHISLISATDQFRYEEDASLDPSFDVPE